MKKLVILMLCGALGMGIGAVQQAKNLQTAGAKEAIVGSPKLAVLVDGRKVKFQGGDPVSENGRIQVPLRGIGEALGATVEYDGASKKVTYIKENKSIVLTMGSKQAVVDNQAVAMDIAAKAVKGRTYVPLRFVSENLGETVEWDGPSNWVWIGEKKIPTPEEAGVVPQSIDEFTQMFGSVSTYFEGKENATIFTVDQLPLKIDSQIIYDIWKVERNGDQGLRVKLSNGIVSLFFLSEHTAGPRVRRQLSEDKIKNSDNSFSLTFRVRSVADREFVEDENYNKFKVEQVDYIGIVGPDVASLLLLKNPFVE